MYAPPTPLRTSLHNLQIPTPWSTTTRCCYRCCFGAGCSAAACTEFFRRAVGPVLLPASAPGTPTGPMVLGLGVTHHFSLNNRPPSPSFEWKQPRKASPTSAKGHPTETVLACSAPLRCGSQVSPVARHTFLLRLVVASWPVRTPLFYTLGFAELHQI